VLGTANLETCQHLPDAAPFTSEPSCGLYMVVEAVLQQPPGIFRFICSERSAPLLLCCHLAGLASRAYIEEFISSVT